MIICALLGQRYNSGMDKPETEKPKRPNNPEFDAFADTAKKLFAVPKAEVDALEAQDRAIRKPRGRRSTKTQI